MKNLTNPVAARRLLEQAHEFLLQLDMVGEARLQMAPDIRAKAQHLAIRIGEQLGSNTAATAAITPAEIPVRSVTTLKARR